LRRVGGKIKRHLSKAKHWAKKHPKKTAAIIAATLAAAGGAYAYRHPEKMASLKTRFRPVPEPVGLRAKLKAEAKSLLSRIQHPASAFSRSSSSY
jgi:hypothetical protein